MAAIITDDFRKNLAQHIIDEIVAGTEKYYIGIGKSDPWTTDAADELVAGFAPSVPDGSLLEKEEVKENLIGLVKVTRQSRVIPRIEYQSGQIYKTYDINDPTAFVPTVSGENTLQPCYAVYDNKIWVCLRNKGGVSTGGSDVPQSGANSYALAGGAGGSNYQWAYVADVVDSSTGFNTSQFIQVSSSDITGTNATNAAAATGGIIYGIKVINGGSGYSNSVTVTLVGAPNTLSDVEGAVGSGDLRITLDGDSISDIDIFAGLITSSYTDASIVIEDSTGSGAEAVALIAPINGFGFNPAKDLPSYYLGLEASLEGNLEGDAPVIDYRQISLLRGTLADIRTDDDDDSPPSGTYNETDTLDTLKYIVASDGTIAGANAVSPGDIIEVANGSDEPSKAFIDHIIGDKIYYHQNNSSLINRKALPSSGSVVVKNRDGSAIASWTTETYTTLGSSEYNRKTGEILFYENRTKITRSDQQTEDIKLVIQL